MKYCCIILFCLRIATAMNAQSAVTSGAGSAASANGYLLEFSIGEKSCIETIESSKTGPVQQVTQGYLQPQTAASADRQSTATRIEAGIYPNPASEVLSLQGNWKNTETARCAILNMEGKILLEQEVAGNTTVFSLAQLTPGVYFLRVHVADEQIVRCFVKI